MKFIDVQAVDGVIQMSRIVKGADFFGVTITEETAFALMDRYVELGGNTIDTARMYGRKPSEDPDHEYSNSEPIVGRWMKARGNRDKIVLVTKGAFYAKATNPPTSRVNKACIDSDLEMSLKELGVDYVDVYFLHRDDPSRPVSEIMDILDVHVKAGRIRALGASNWTISRINEANVYARANGKTPFTISQIQWSVAQSSPEAWDDPTLVCMNDTEYAGYLENKIPVMGYAPQAGGYFSKLMAGQPLKEKIAARYDCAENRRRLEKMRAVCERLGTTAGAVNMAYITSNPLSGAAIIGCSTVEQLNDTMSDMALALDEQTRSELVK